MHRALSFPEMADFRRKVWPGSIHIDGKSGETQRLFFVCPCGCGEVDMLRVGAGFKPDAFPSWEWTGSTTEPTLAPSVNRKGHWHGYLKNGYWEAVE